MLSHGYLSLYIVGVQGWTASQRASRPSPVVFRERVWGSPCEGGGHPWGKARRHVFCCSHFCLQLIEVLPWFWNAVLVGMTFARFIHWSDWVSIWAAWSVLGCFWDTMVGEACDIPGSEYYRGHHCFPPWLGGLLQSSPVVGLFLRKSNNWFLVLSYFSVGLSDASFIMYV